MRGFIKLILAALAQVPVCAHSQDLLTALHYSSPQNEFIGGGEEVTIGERSGIFGRDVFEQTVILIFSQDNFPQWELAISNRRMIPAVPLASGVPYRSAFRYPAEANGSPGISFSGEGRGCNQLVGEFTVRELMHDGDGWRIAIDFVQNCEFSPLSLIGQWRDRSTVPIRPSLIFFDGNE